MLKKTLYALLIFALFIGLGACSNGKLKTTPVNNIILSSTSIDMVVDENYYLTYTILPENATDYTVSYQLSNSEIITLSDTGSNTKTIKISAKKAGKATITVFTNNGVNVICNVVVLEKPAYDRLTDEEKKFVDLFVPAAERYFLDPQSVNIKNVYHHMTFYTGVLLTAKNNFGGMSEVYLYLDEAGLEKAIQKKSFPSKNFNIDLVNEAIQDKFK